MRIATWNVNSLGVRLPRVEEWLEYARPDVVCLQETKLADSAFPGLAFETLGYEAAHHGEGRWNGVAILSRVGLTDVDAGFGPDDGDPEARLLWATCGGVRVASVYVPNGRALDHEQYAYKLEWLGRLRALVGDRHHPGEPILVGGDFNVAPTDDDLWDVDEFVDATHVSPPERDAVAALVDWGLVDLFRRLHPEPGLYSWWDYRAGNFHKRKGMRIDLLLGTAPLAENLRFTLIDRQARKGSKPSDHAPVLVDVDL